jgi:hypothetical protein
MKTHIYMYSTLHSYITTAAYHYDYLLFNTLINNNILILLIYKHYYTFILIIR